MKRRSLIYIGVGGITAIGAALTGVYLYSRTPDLPRDVAAAQPPRNEDPSVFNPRVVIRRPFRAIGSGRLKPVPAAQAGDAVTDSELVLGVAVNGESRAYTINSLTGPRREIFNDSLGNRAIAATW